MNKYAPTILRLGMSLVFIWFGSQQLLHNADWVAYIPNYAISFSHLSAETLTYINGAFEVIFGLALFFGFKTRIVAFLLALHMLDITYTVGYNPVGVRDFGLALATVSLFLNGPSPFGIDEN